MTSVIKVPDDGLRPKLLAFFYSFNIKFIVVWLGVLLIFKIIKLLEAIPVILIPTTHYCAVPMAYSPFSLGYVRSVGPKLVPFFKTVAIYFVIFIPQDKPSIFSVILKCLPIVSLMLFVLLNGMSLGDEYKYSRRILTGLIFCCIGDALLIWNQYFDLGMLAFIIGHIQYILAFGFKPLQLPLAMVLYSLGTMAILYLLPDLHGIIVIGVPIYIFVITTMLWRAIARVQFFEDLWTWSKLCSCAGGTLFAISDLLLGINRFKFSIEHIQALVMSTYYAGQFGIAVSVVDATAALNEDKNKNKSL